VTVSFSKRLHAISYVELSETINSLLGTLLVAYIFSKLLDNPIIKVMVHFVSSIVNRYSTGENHCYGPQVAQCCVHKIPLSKTTLFTYSESVSVRYILILSRFEVFKAVKI
jgi:hypothetical protein